MENLDNALAALDRFISSRSGIDWRNYGGSREAFMADYRRILRDGRDARAMLAWTREIAAFARVFHESPLDDWPAAGVNRLRWDGKAWDFTACQYHAVEYRAAACRLLAQAAIIVFGVGHGPGCRAEIRRRARNAFGPAIAKRWF